jgi:methyl-accepting chemotaxis protein
MMVESVSNVTLLVDGIARAAREQSIGISEINAAVNQLDQVTQQNAAMVEDSIAASHAMSGEARTLSNLVGQF